MLETYVGYLVSEKLLSYCIKQVQHIHVCLYSSGLPGVIRTSADQNKDKEGITNYANTPMSNGTGLPIVSQSGRCLYGTATQVGLQKIMQFQRCTKK